MTVKITLEYGSVEEAIVALGRLAQVAKVRRAATNTPPAFESEGIRAVAVPAPAPEKKPRGRPRKQEASTAGNPPSSSTAEQGGSAKAEIPPAETVPAAETTGAAVDASPAPTEADAKAALEAYFEKNGPQKAMAKLSSFGVSRLRDLPEGERNSFIKACSE